MPPLRLNPLGPAASPGSEVLLLPERAVYWPHTRTLLIADLHLGKCETIRAAGGPIPESILQADLARLASVIVCTEAARVIVLGDLLHAAIGVTPWLIDEVARWRERSAPDATFVLVPGNHDTRIGAIAGAWRLEVADKCLEEGPFAFCHEPCERSDRYTWSGHIHPLALIRGRRDSLSLPCFWLAPHCGVLPAFSAFTGGVCVPAAPGERVFAVADDRLIEV